MSLPIERHSVRLEDFLSSGSVEIAEHKGLSPAEVSLATEYYLSVGFDLRMLGRMIGKEIRVHHYVKRRKDMTPTGVRVVVETRG